MSADRKLFLIPYAWLLALFWIFGGCGSLCAQSPTANSPLTAKQFSDLFQHQPVLADHPIFDGDSFPKIDFLNKDLIKAALGSYSLTIRFFDAGWNEVQKPTAPGRYGAYVQIHFPNGAADTRHLTLFKTAVPYIAAKDPYRAVIQYPAAFGVSKELVESEQWNSENFIDGLIEGASHEDVNYAVFVAAMHDIAADPTRWHGFNYWRVEDEWWAVLDVKVGLPQDYQRLVALPKDYDQKPTDRWPLILFLHGSGERGDDLNVLKQWGPGGYIGQGHPLPFIVVTPQCPVREWWSPEKLSRLIDQIEASYRIDPKRIYVTGLSMGGYGTFDLAATYPERFAAIAPLSGGENPEIAERLKTVPTWIFHGMEDNVVPTRYSVDIADRMKAIGAEVKLTLYPGVGHGGWDKTYADPTLYAWFLQHSR